MVNEIARKFTEKKATWRPDWIPPSLWKYIWEREEGCCLCCRRQIAAPEQVSAHHLLPREMGGKTCKSNIVLLDKLCHDRLELAQEAGLLATNNPPRYMQLFGIFEVGGEAMPADKGNTITEFTKRFHAERIFRYGKIRAENLLRHAKSMGCWPHVDWPYLKAML